MGAARRLFELVADPKCRDIVSGSIYIPCLVGRPRSATRGGHHPVVWVQLELQRRESSSKRAFLEHDSVLGGDLLDLQRNDTNCVHKGRLHNDQDNSVRPILRRIHLPYLPDQHFYRG